jgi:DNA polymerase-3 subunit gamma/tau
LIAVLEAQSQDTAADLLSRGEWNLAGNQINLRLPLSEKVIDLSVSADAKRLLTQEASRLCGRVMKLNVTGGGTSQTAPIERVPNGNGNSAGGARQRAADDPVVRRMQEKFGAEVRTVVDLRQKK